MGKKSYFYYNNLYVDLDENAAAYFKNEAAQIVKKCTDGVKKEMIEICKNNLNKMHDQLSGTLLTYMIDQKRGNETPFEVTWGDDESHYRAKWTSHVALLQLLGGFKVGKVDGMLNGIFIQ